MRGYLHALGRVLVAWLIILAYIAPAAAAVGLGVAAAATTGSDIVGVAVCLIVVLLSSAAILTQLDP